MQGYKFYVGWNEGFLNPVSITHMFQMQRRKAPIRYKRLLRKINREGIISRKAFFRAIESKHENYIPTYFQGMIIPSITHRHGYFISKKFLKEKSDKYGFYTTKSGITFHKKGDTDSVLKYLIRRRQHGITAEEARELCKRDCKRALAIVIEDEKYSSENILGTTVYLYNRRKKTQRKIRLTNSRIEPRIEEIDGKPMIPLEEVGDVLEQLVGDEMDYRSFMVSFLTIHLSSTWRNLSGKLKYDQRYRELIDMAEKDDIHFTTLNKYFLNLDISDLETLFKTLVGELVGEEVIKGKYLAIDSTHIFAWANQDNPRYKDPYPESNSYDDESILQFAQHGFHQGRFYGYKCHLIIDCKSELPVAITITSGNSSDMSQIIPLIEDIDAIDLKEVERLIGDAGYDFSDEIDKVNKRIKGMMMTDTNPRRSKPLKSMKKMVKGIFDKFGHKIKNIDDALQRIPQKLLTHFGVKIGNERESAIIKMVQYHLNTGLRVAVERTFSRLKGLLPFERPKLQKDTSVIKNILLCVNWMLLTAYAAKRLDYDENIRQMASIV